MNMEKETRKLVALLVGALLAAGCRSAPEEVFPAVATSATGAVAEPVDSELGGVDASPVIPSTPTSNGIATGSAADLDREAQALWRETGSERARLYREARRLETEGRYESALEHYAALLEKDPEHADAAQRHRTLVELSGLAQDCYGWALAALGETDVDSTLYYFRQIRLFWPDYEDVERQIAALEESLEGGLELSR